MRFYIFLSVLVAAFIYIECKHTFMGTNVMRQQVFHRNAKFSSRTFRKRVEYLNFTMPTTYGYGRSIQGFLAYDLTNSGASANVTSGGIGYPYLSLRMKSDRGSEIHYDVFIYA